MPKPRRVTLTSGRRTSNRQGQGARSPKGTNTREFNSKATAFLRLSGQMPSFNPIPKGNILPIIPQPVPKKVGRPLSKEEVLERFKRDRKKS